MRAILVLISLILCMPNTRAETAEPEIDWFKGSMDSAMAEARKTKKPIFVYWGAVWCPPCNALKAKAFHEPSFVAATKKFVSVYLDGDTTDAQVWGERLHASGYPTLMILNSQGKEIQRLPSDASLDELTEQVKALGNELEPLEELFHQALTPGGKKNQISQEDWRRLAHHDWLNDARWNDRLGELAIKLKDLSKALPKEMKYEVTQLQLMALSARMNFVDEVKLPHGLGLEERREGLELVHSILADPARLNSHADMLAFNAMPFAMHFFPEAESKNQLWDFVHKYRNAFLQYREQKNLTLENRLYSIFPIVNLSDATDKRFPSLGYLEKSKIRSTAREELQNAKTEQQKIFIYGAVAEIFQQLGDADEAKKILNNALDQVQTKNELMLSLSELESNLGHVDEALAWSEKAYENAKGHATRFEWGSKHVRNLIKWKPKESDRIAKQLFQVLEESAENRDSFSGRFRKTRKRMLAALKTWAEDQKQHLDGSKLTKIRQSTCFRRGSGREYRQRCQEFFQELMAI